MIVKTNPEFGIELALVLPYAYYLHTIGELDTVITSKGMKPYYYFCDDVHEDFDMRTIDNGVALQGIPNQWIHHNAFAVTGKDYNELTAEEQLDVNGVLDYRKWISPPYKDFYKNEEFKYNTKTVFLTNKYNIEHGEKPLGYFDIECLYNMFNYFRDKKYTVIYKRATNKESEFATDQNEQNSLHQGYTDIRADVDGIGIITDFELTKYFDNVILMDDIVNKSKYNYNETQLRVMANCDKFISVCGGNSILSSLFGGLVISYIHKGKELRPNYFGKNSYFRKLSNANIIPAIDNSVVKSGIHDYSELLTKMKEYF
jgi:hypothetical protein